MVFVTGICRCQSEKIWFRHHFRFRFGCRFLYKHVGAQINGIMSLTGLKLWSSSGLYLLELQKLMEHSKCWLNLRPKRAKIVCNHTGHQGLAGMHRTFCSTVTQIYFLNFFLNILNLVWKYDSPPPWYCGQRLWYLFNDTNLDKEKKRLAYNFKFLVF